MIELSPNTWYRLGALLDAPAIELQDGASIRRGNAHFAGSILEAVTGPASQTGQGPQSLEPSQTYRYLHLLLKDVERADLDRLPAPVAISSRLLRENMLYLRASSYAYDVLVRDGYVTCHAQGDVCAGWRIDPRGRPGEIPPDKSREVAAAHRRGLLDDIGRSKAEFRLRIKPTMRRLAEALDAGYLPSDAWQVSVMFARWQRQATDMWVSTPFASEGDAGALDQVEIRFIRHDRPRDFRLSDLFDHGASP